MLKERLVLYTTIYPGVERFLAAWYESVLKQTDTNFDIWIGVDKIDVSRITTALGTEPAATWVIATEDDSPAQVRQKAIERLVNQYPAVIFADSDDVLEPTRVEGARGALQTSDVSGCAMRVIDDNGKDLGIVSQPPNGNVTALLPRYNVFGLSNTTYRSEILRQCLPIPAKCVLVDWFLATRAWALGAHLAFDFTCRMAYRQYAANIARILPPFTSKQVISATERVLNHYVLVLGDIPELQPQHRIEIETANKRALTFYKSVTNSADTLNKYVQALNRLPLNHIWWECVAHPQLEYIWRS